MLKSSVTEMGNATCISLQGRIDGITSSDIERQMKECLLEGKRNLIIDFEQINYVSSAGLRVFLMIQKQLKQAGGEIVLAAMPPAVKDVFRVSGFAQLFRIVESKEAAAAAQQSDIPAIETTHTVINNISLIHHKNTHASSGRLISIGNPDKLSHAAYEESDVVPVSSSDISFGAGLATAGDTFNDYKDFFGEAIVIDRHLFFYPATRRPVVDFMLHADEHFLLTYRFLHGFGFHGPFMHLVAFDGGGSTVELTRLRSTLLALTGAKAAGIVLLAESKGIWGMHLKQVPTADRQPGNGEEIFSDANFPHWFDFPVEAGSVNHIVAATGIGVQDGVAPDPVLKKVLGGDEMGHFHACVFQNDILSKKPDHFESELHRVVSKLTPLKVQHLLGQSAFSSGLAGIIELSDNREIKA